MINDLIDIPDLAHCHLTTMNIGLTLFFQLTSLF